MTEPTDATADAVEALINGVPMSLLHDAPCSLSKPTKWRWAGDHWQGVEDCQCADSPGVVLGDGAVRIEEPSESPIADALFDLPEVNVRRGGIAFAGGWCAPSDAIYNLIGPSKPLTKKELRERVKYLEKTLERVIERIG
jgi:hypothetical protein